MADFKYTYDEFPGWDDSCAGMQVIKGDKENVYVVHQVVKYGQKNDYPLHIHFLFPETLDTERKYPLIIHVRGSAWLEQNMTGLIGAYVPIITAGYAVAFVQYRPVTVAKFPAQICDLKTAARFIMENSTAFPIDTGNIFLAGDSSGGHTAILGYLTWNEKEFDNPDESTGLPELRGLIDFYGVTDIKSLSETETGYPVEYNSQLASALFTVPASEDPEMFRQSSAFSWLDLKPQLAPVLILHGNKDRLVPLSQSVELFKALRAKGTECDFYMVDQADHGRSVFWCKAVTDQVISFLDRNIR